MQLRRKRQDVCVCVYDKHGRSMLRSVTILRSPFIQQANQKKSGLGVHISKDSYVARRLVSLLQDVSLLRPYYTVGLCSATFEVIIITEHKYTTMRSHRRSEPMDDYVFLER